MPLSLVPGRDRTLNRIVKSVEPWRVVRGGVVYARGEEAEDVILVREGHLVLTADPGSGGSAGRGPVVAVAGPGELVGLEAARRSAGVPRLHTARAGETSRVQALDGPAVFRALQRAPGTLEALVAALERDLARVTALVPTTGGPDVRSRIAAVLLDLAERLGQPAELPRNGGSGRWIPCRIPHRVLGDLSGAHRSTVTTTLNDWLYDGILHDADLGYLVVDAEALRGLGEGGAAGATGTDGEGPGDVDRPPVPR